MNTARKISTARTGKRLASAAVTTLFASTILALAPTTASAFDIGGLIDTLLPILPVPRRHDVRAQTRVGYRMRENAIG